MKLTDVRANLAAWDRGFEAGFEGRVMSLRDLTSQAYHDGYRAGLIASQAAAYPRCHSQEPMRLQ